MEEVINIGMAGFGNVGSGTYKVLKRNAEEIARRAGKKLNIKTVVVRKPERIASLVDENVKVSKDLNDILNDPDIDVVVEVMGGIEPARSFVLGAIEAGKHIVTANKALLAEHGNEIFSAAQDKGVNVAFEAAVAGSVPIIKALREGLAANKIHWVAGIINGTCNFILSTMRNTGRAFDDVLAEAQKLGYAEADPTFDIEGIDTAHKTMILASIAFGVPVDMSRIHIEGISRLEATDIKFAEELGYRIKLLGITKMTDKGVEVRVHPTLIPASRLIANVEGAMNAIVVKNDAADSQLFYGKGAGAEPTGSAVIADLVDIARTLDAKTSQRPLMPTLDIPGDNPWAPFGETVCSYYLRIPVDDKAGVLADIARIIADNSISIESFIQKEAPYPETRTEFILMTHKAKEADVQRAVRTIQEHESVLGPIVILRKEEMR